MTLAAYSARPQTATTEKILRFVLGAMLGLSCLSFIEPSPYEFFFFLLFPAVFLNDFRLKPLVMVLFFLLATIVVSQFLALIPYIEFRAVENNLTPAIYTMYTVYLYLSAFLFALIFSEQTNERLPLALKAYAFSCVFAGAWGILSFIDFMGLNAREPVDGRIAGPFKDPNVLGSYCIMGVLYLMQSILLERRHTFIKIVGLGIAFVGGVFFSFSRGSLGAMTFGMLFMVGATFATGDHAIRKRLIAALGVLVVVLAVSGVYVVTSTSVGETVTQRAKLEQEYDGGETGRFGNQKRSIPMLIERPFGFGPIIFPTHFGLQPHNSYIGAFSDAGWAGGLTFIILVASTSFLGIRLAFIKSPFRRHAQVVTPAALGFFLQALQIDIDHWRFVFLMIGAIWGMEAARRTLLWREAHAPVAREPVYRAGEMAMR